MKKMLIICLVLFHLNDLKAQQTVFIPNESDSRAISTGMPFMGIASDARAAALGDMGVATSFDAYAQSWNPAKYSFSEHKVGFTFSYTPYLRKLVNDIGVAYVSYYNRINERSAFAGSFRYFGMGKIELYDATGGDMGSAKPNEFALDASYSLRLGAQFSLAVAMRYMKSDLRINYTNDSPPANSSGSFGVDITGFYQSEEKFYNDYNGRWRIGFAIQNMGPKFKYDDEGDESFLPTTLRLGSGFDFIFDDYNKISVTAEVSKLLVPTPPVYGKEREYIDENSNGIYDDGDVLIDEDKDSIDGIRNPVVIIEGKDPNVSFMSGIFQSFGDAPGGFKEEMQEFTFALSAEYLYQNSFAFRVGYFSEHENKGARKFFSLGAGFKYNMTQIDLSYLFSKSSVQSPLEGTMRFSLAFNIGEGTYYEY